jgi:hypothetical protein
MPVIVVEGPDESGKSTLAAALRVMIHPQPIFRRSPATFAGSPWNEYTCQLVDELSTSPNLYIMDRCSEISEMVYGPTIRGTARPASYIHEWYDWDERVCLIFAKAYRDPLDLHRDVTGRPIDNSQHEQTRAIYEVMHAMFRHHPNVMTIPYTWVEPLPTFGSIKEWMEGLKPQNMQPEFKFHENTTPFVYGDNNEAMKHYILASSMIAEPYVEGDMMDQRGDWEGVE